MSLQLVPSRGFSHYKMNLKMCLTSKVSNELKPGTTKGGKKWNQNIWRILERNLEFYFQLIFVWLVMIATWILLALCKNTENYHMHQTSLCDNPSVYSSQHSVAQNQIVDSSNRLEWHMACDIVYLNKNLSIRNMKLTAGTNIKIVSQLTLWIKDMEYHSLK